MRGAVRYLGYADEFTPEPDSELVIEAGRFRRFFPPERWHHIEVMTDDTLFNIEFFVEPEVLKSL
ncbi:Putative cytoplasmic protein [Enterobacter hormaechei]|nr:Putative cytoplasmic protein [Enterobacter hormaechei]